MTKWMDDDNGYNYTNVQKWHEILSFCFSSLKCAELHRIIQQGNDSDIVANFDMDTIQYSSLGMLQVGHQMNNLIVSFYKTHPLKAAQDQNTASQA
jgi:hypothetical protein